MHTIQNNLDNEYLSDLRVRKAIAYAIDKDQFNELAVMRNTWRETSAEKIMDLTESLGRDGRDLCNGVPETLPTRR